MSGGPGNFRPSLAHWRAGTDNGAYTSSHEEPNLAPRMLPRSQTFQVPPDVRPGTVIPVQPSEGRAIIGPSGLAGRFSGQTLSPVSILGMDDNMARQANPVPSQTTQPFPQRFTGYRYSQVPTPQQNPTPTRSEMGSVGFRKEVYRASPKKLTRRMNMYYRDKRHSLNETENEKDDDGKRCAVCLDDFEAGEEVILTPCDHMFHEDCIMPWVKSNGQCPVCRRAFDERRRERAPNINNNDIAFVSANEIAGELMAIIRAMEVAFLWGQHDG